MARTAAVSVLSGTLPLFLQIRVTPSSGAGFSRSATRTFRVPVVDRTTEVAFAVVLGQSIPTCQIFFRSTRGRNQTYLEPSLEDGARVA